MNAPKTNISGIARAGRSASSTYGNIADTARKYGPRYDEMAVADVKARSQEKQAAIIAERNVRAAEAKAENLLERTEIDIDTYNAKRSAAKTSRKAGMIAAAGQLAGIALEKKEEPIRPTSLNFDKQYEALNKRLADDEATIKAGPKPYTGPTYTPPNEEQAGDNSPSNQSTTLASKSGGQPAGKALNPPSKLVGGMGFNAKQWNTYKEAVAGIESGGKYNIMGGSNNHYDGRYQLGAAAKTDGARIAGIADPGHGASARVEFRNNPQMQETLFEGYTGANHRYLMNNPKYANATPEEKLSILGYAHNQGMGGAEKWLNTGQVGRDGFGTAGTKYVDAIRSGFGLQN